MRGTCRELAAEAPLLAPSELTHFDFSTRAHFEAVNEDTPLSFCAGRSLVDDQRVLVPALLCFASFRSVEPEPIFIKPGGTGLAAHTNEAAAIRHALLEVLERDACMLSWRVPGWPCRWLEMKLIRQELLRVCAQLELEVELYAVGEPGCVPVVVALLLRPDGTQLTVGSPAGWDAASAAERALNEALMLQWTVAHCSAQWDGAGLPTSLLEHVLSAARRGPEVRGWYRRQALSAPLPESSSGTEPETLCALARRVEQLLGAASWA